MRIDDQSAHPSFSRNFSRNAGANKHVRILIPPTW